MLTALTGARVLTPDKEFDFGAVVMAGLLILMNPHPGLGE